MVFVVGGGWVSLVMDFLCFYVIILVASISLLFFSLFLYIWLLRKWWKRKKYLVGQIW